MAARKRKGPKHPGVVLIKADPTRRTWWRARFKDPDSGKVVKETLPVSLTTAPQREEWAVRKSRELAKRKLELEGGAVRKTNTGLKTAIERYFDAHPNLSPRTREDYRCAADRLLEWAGVAQVSSADDLTKAKLKAYREATIRRPKQAVSPGKRGARKAVAELRAPESVNTELRKVRVVLGYLRSIDLLPRVSNDDLKDGLKRMKVPMEAPEFMRPHELQQLLDAALAHDAETFAETREEHAGQRTKGTTKRYEPIAPFVACVLLGGFRLSEALGLRWSGIDLSTVDADGKPKGEILLKASETKTRRGRIVTLGVSPTLREVLEGMHERKGEDLHVFGGKEPMPKSAAEAARKRLVGTYGAPKSFTWQALRRTCATYQANAQSLFGDAAVWTSAKRLGHSVVIAERRYAGLIDVSRDARTLEAAMQIEAEMGRVVASVARPHLKLVGVA